MPIKKKKKKIKKLSTLKITEAKAEWEIHPLKKARAVENWEQLGEFVEWFAPAMDPKYLAEYVYNFSMSSYNTTIIIKDKKMHKHIKKLLHAIDKAKGGAAEIFNEPETKGHECALGEFCHFTGYMPANSERMFQNHISDFKDVFGLRRSKKKATYGNFIDRESFKNN